MKENASRPLSLRFAPFVRKTVKKMSEDSGITQAQLYDLILRAGCETIEKNDYRWEMPLKFDFAKK